MKEVRVNLGVNSYGILVGSELLKQAGKYLKEIQFQDKAVVITDTTVRRLYGELLEQSLTANGFKVYVLEVSEGEEQKSLERAGILYTELSKVGAERMTSILALGGGVIGDLTGFVAATFKRGLPLVQVPTTLLAQVDSSIGGKVAVNHGQLKNEIGAFYQPRLVIADVSTLKSLPPSEISDGLAEIIKYAVIKDGDFFTYLEKNVERIKSLDEAVVGEVVYRSARIKAEVIEQDEKDLGLRNILNYGHTAGHAIESASDFKMGHGESVAIGMLVAGEVSKRLGMLSASELARLKDLIQKAGLPVKMPGLNIEKVIQTMKHDKKIVGGKVRFVLAKSIGEVLVTDKVDLSLVEKVLVDFNEET